ncbi:hypothetical protein BpHYR1_004496, partial [Brachionus plicatilis]
LSAENEERCKSCKLVFEFNPTFLFIKSAEKNIFIHELPDVITCDNRNYNFLCATLNKPGHTVSIFNNKDN